MGVSLEDRYKAVHAIYVQAMASAGFDPEIASEAFDMSVGSVAMESAIGSVAKGISGIKGAGSKIINSVDDVKFNQKSVDHAFSKHKADFGNYPDGSKASVNQFTNDVKTLIENGTQKAGTYRSMPGTHIYNPTTKQWVFINSDGTFNAAFKLSDEQFKYLIETGVVK